VERFEPTQLLSCRLESNPFLLHLGQYPGLGGKGGFLSRQKMFVRGLATRLYCSQTVFSLDR